MNTTIEIKTEECIMGEFEKFLGGEVTNDDDRFDSSCDFIVIPKCCQLIDGGKRGWINCGKCIIEYNCENGGTQEFQEFIKNQNCRVEWLYPHQLGVWIIHLHKLMRQENKDSDSDEDENEDEDDLKYSDSDIEDECCCVENLELKNTIKTNNKHIEELKEQDRRRDEEIARLVGLLTEENECQKERKN